MYNRWYEFWWCWERSILGFIDTGGASVHADVGLQNVVVGEELTLFSGKKSRSRLESRSICNLGQKTTSWGGAEADSNVIVGTRAGQFLKESTSRRS
jgi:hypothetical protein